MNILELKRIGQIVNFETDHDIFMQGESGDKLYILLKGTVLVYITSDFDGSVVELVRLSEGSIFGEMSVVTGEKRSASVKAVTDVIALTIDKANFDKFISLQPQFAVNMMKTLTKRYFETMEKVSELRGESNG